MKQRTMVAVALGVTLGTISAARAADHPQGTTTETPNVHEAYVEAINSNDVGKLLAMMTDDVVFLAPNAAPIIGKAALQPWLEGYVAAYTTHWDKQVEEFVPAGEWAFERYSYKSTDTPREGGEAIVGTGWGLVIYHHDHDGVWRVARDAWGSDQP